MVTWQRSAVNWGDWRSVRYLSIFVQGMTSETYVEVEDFLNDTTYNLILNYDIFANFQPCELYFVTRNCSQLDL